jgi:serine/threonine protein kinase/tetratricopeptide (TPR) repeat protein
MRDLIGRTLGHYRILDKIGAGGMGEVYRAHDERLDRDVAVKVLHESVAQDADRLVRFEREAKAVAKLAHPNILEIWDFGSEGGVTYAVTELLEGESLRKLVSKGGITTGKAVEYARAIADGLTAAHDKRIIHRDLKPENVFLTTDGRIKILDFGLAKLKLPEADLTTETPTATLDTAPGGLIGTVPYMAPEQVQGQRADHRSDIFALGAVLYEMLTGHRPFGGSTTVEIAAAILKEDPEPVSVAAPAVPPTLSSVVSKCLEKRPEDRFSSAHDLSLTLGAIDFTAPAPPVHDRLVIGKRWPHILAVVIAAAIALFFVFPPEGLFERLAEQPAEAAPPRIVVLPFENLGSPDDEYFADGITEEITSRLAAVSGLQVISRTSAMYYKDRRLPVKQIGEELDVDYVLEGTIRWDRSGVGHGRVRITPQLIKVADDVHLWSERYDRVLEDIFSVQTDIAEQVIAQLEVALIEPERRTIEARPTDNMEAYQAYLKGVEYARQPGFVERDLELAIALLERALELDPSFVLAYTALAEAHLAIHWRVFASSERVAKAETAIENALALAPDMPEVRVAKGLFHYQGQRNYEAALKEFVAAKQRLVNDSEIFLLIGCVERRQAKWEAGLTNIKRAFDLDPLSGTSALELGLTLVFMRRYDEAKQYLEKSIELVPDQEIAYRALASVYWADEGNLEQARSTLEAMPRCENPFSFQVWVLQYLLERDYPSALEVLAAAPNELAWREPEALWEGLTYQLIGDFDRAENSFERGRVELTRRFESEIVDPWWSHCHLALALARLGHSEAALLEAHRAEEMFPLSTDAVFGSLLAVRIAEVHLAAGDYGGALDRIEHLLSIPAGLEMSRSLLEIDPRWDPLRDHPRFQALLEEYEVE